MLHTRFDSTHESIASIPFVSRVPEITQIHDVDRIPRKGSSMAEMLGRPSARMVRQRIGPTLRSMRLRRQLSLNELAESASISPSHLSRIERGLTVPSYDVLDNIASALGSDLNSLRSKEKSARAVDDELRQLFGKLGLGEEAQEELLGLSHETRQSLADVLLRVIT